MRRREQGITLVEITAAVTVVLILVALLVPVAVKSARYKTVMECQDHLKTMHRAQAAAPASKVQEIGRAYWVRLVKLDPPLLQADVLKCPFVDVPDAPFCQYYGPGGEVGKLEAKDPIGCDMDFNHSDNRRQGGNVLLKSGEVVTDHTGLWGGAIQSGRVR